MQGRKARMQVHVLPENHIPLGRMDSGREMGGRANVIGHRSLGFAGRVESYQGSVGFFRSHPPSHCRPSGDGEAHLWNGAIGDAHGTRSEA